VFKQAGAVAAAGVEHGIKAAMAALDQVEQPVGTLSEPGCSSFGKADPVEADEFAGVEPPGALLRPAVSAIDGVESDDVFRGKVPPGPVRHVR
jgi:hypothetical protein